MGCPQAWGLDEVLPIPLRKNVSCYESFKKASELEWSFGTWTECWDRGFECRWGHGYSSLVFVECCVGSGLCYKAITGSEESCRVSVSLIVCDLKATTISRSRPDLGPYATERRVYCVRTPKFYLSFKNSGYSCVSYFLHSCYMYSLSHTPWFDYPPNTN
jgi:hypothetical protein